jgi:predicted MFS family arabinose efflux permease
MSNTETHRTPYAILIVASLVLTLSMGLRNSFGLFLNPMVADVGITSGIFGLSMAVQNLVWGITQPVLGAIADRMGTRPVLAASAVLFALGILLMGQSTDPRLGLGLGGGLLVGIGVAGSGFGTLMGAVARATPPKDRSWAIGVVSAAGSLGTIAIAPGAQYSIQAFGWRDALLVLVLVAGVMAVLALFIGGRSSMQSSNDTGQTLKQALAEACTHPGFLLMGAAFFACGFQLAFIATHLPGYLVICGLAPSTGATALALIGLFNAAGSYAAGWLGGRYNKSILLASVYLFRTIGVAVFLMYPVSTESALTFAAFMGLLWLSVAPLVSGLIGQLFGLRHFNALFGLLFLSHQLGSFAGAWMGGIVRDATGSYMIGWVLLLVVGSAAFAMQCGMTVRPVARLREAGQMA